MASKRDKAAKIPPEQVVTVFNYWLTIHKSNQPGRVPKLDDGRYLTIAAAIHDWGIEDCLTAIEGCKKSDFHMGRNKTKKLYNDIELILRNRVKMESFIELTDGTTGEDGDPW